MTPMLCIGHSPCKEPCVRDALRRTHGRRVEQRRGGCPPRRPELWPHPRGTRSTHTATAGTSLPRAERIRIALAQRQHAPPVLGANSARSSLSRTCRGAFGIGEAMAKPADNTGRRRPAWQRARAQKRSRSSGPNRWKKPESTTAPNGPGNRAGWSASPTRKLHQPAGTQRGRSCLGTGLGDRGLGKIYTQNGEAALGKGKREFARAAPDVEHGASGWILVEQRHQGRLRLADVPRWCLAVGRIEESLGRRGSEMLMNATPCALR